MSLTQNEQVAAYVRQTLERIHEEARLTKPPAMSMDEAIAILIEDRRERNLFSQAEAELAREIEAQA